jgi:predicted metal-dependent hydrolase
MPQKTRRKNLPGLTYKIIRSKRRTIALIITQDGFLKVRAPFNASLVIIEKFALEKKTWIENKISLVNKNRARVIPKKFTQGEEFTYEGNIYKLQLSNSENISISDALYLPKKFLPDAKQHLITWYKKQALAKIVNRVNHHADCMQLKYKSIKLSTAKEAGAHAVIKDP